MDWAIFTHSQTASNRIIKLQFPIFTHKLSYCLSPRPDSSIQLHHIFIYLEWCWEKAKVKFFSCSFSKNAFICWSFTSFNLVNLLNNFYFPNHRSLLILFLNFASRKINSEHYSSWSNRFFKIFPFKISNLSVIEWKEKISRFSLCCTVILRMSGSCQFETSFQ